MQLSLLRVQLSEGVYHVCVVYSVLVAVTTPWAYSLYKNKTFFNYAICPEPECSRWAYSVHSQSEPAQRPWRHDLSLQLSDCRPMLCLFLWRHWRRLRCVRSLETSIRFVKLFDRGHCADCRIGLTWISVLSMLYNS